MAQDVGSGVSASDEPKWKTLREGSLDGAMATNSPRLQRWHLVLLASLGALLFFAGLGTGSLRDFDEAIYAQVARELAEGGDPLALTANGVPWFHKPPLAIWATAILYRLFGVGEGTARAVSAMSGLITVLLVYILGRRHFGYETALAGAFVLLSTPHFVEYSKLGMLDVPLTLAVTTALLAWMRAETDQRWYVVAGAALGAGVMIKGMAAVVIPVAATAHLLVSGSFSRLRSPWLWTGLAVAAAVCLPWHIQQWWVHGDAFLGEYLGYHVIERIQRPLEGHEGGRFYYLAELLKNQLPWSLPLLPALPWSLRELWRSRRSPLSLPLCWAGAVLTLYTPVATKISWYLMPAYPAVSLLVGAWLVHVVPCRRFGRLLGVLVAMVILLPVHESRVRDLDWRPEVAALARQAAAGMPAGEALLLWGVPDPTVRFYAERPVVSIGDTREALSNALAARPGRVRLLLRGEDRLAHVRNRAPGAETLGRRGDLVLVEISGATSLDQ